MGLKKIFLFNVIACKKKELVKFYAGYIKCLYLDVLACYEQLTCGFLQKSLYLNEYIVLIKMHICIVDVK